MNTNPLTHLHNIRDERIDHLVLEGPENYAVVLNLELRQPRGRLEDALELQGTFTSLH